MDAKQFFHNVIRSFYANNLAPSLPRSKYFVAWMGSTAVRPANTAESNAQWNQFIFQTIERTTPPSTRNAAPLVAAESGLATIATSTSTSSVVVKRCNYGPGRAVRKNSRSISATVAFFDFAKPARNFSTPSERVGPAGIELAVTLVT
jgi:hypothetical protein